MKRLFLPLALAGLFAGTAGAAEPPLRAGLAFRTGVTLSGQDHLNDNILGMGVSVDRAFSEGWSARLELNYLYKPGRSYRGDLLSPASGKPAASPSRSGEFKKNRLDALGLRGSALFRKSDELALVAGVQLGKSRFTHEYIGQTVDASATYYDTYNGAPTESALHASPFVGLEWAYDRDFVFEVNLLGLSYTAIDFRHTPGSALVGGDKNKPGSTLVYAGDQLAKTRRMLPTVEVGCRFRF